MGVSIAMAVVDTAGRKAAFFRMPGSFLASDDFARWKAWTAVSFSMKTSDFASMLRSLPTDVARGLLDHPEVTDLPGGCPIVSHRQIIGAVGISGGSGEQDDMLSDTAAIVLAE